MDRSLKRTVILLIGVCFLMTGTTGASEAKKSNPWNPDVTLKILTAGNKRFISGSAIHPNQNTCRRGSLAETQKPRAVIVCCADSRAPPEVLFDRGLGDIFVVRTAGEVVTDVELGSIEYGAEHLGATLIMVLGHERCGAVAATVKGGKAPGHIGSIVALIKPAVDEARKAGEKGLLERAIRIHIRNMTRKIAASEQIAALIKEKKVRVVKAYYDLDSGLVEILK